MQKLINNRLDLLVNQLTSAGNSDGWLAGATSSRTGQLHIQPAESDVLLGQARDGKVWAELVTFP